MFLNHAHIIPNEIRPDGGIEPFMKMADIFELEGAVCFAPFSYLTDSLGLNPNQWLYRQIRSQDHFFGYGTLDPKKSPKDQINEIAELGFKGVKLHPAAQNFAVFSNWARESYEHLIKHNLIADFHTGIHWHRLSAYNPILFDEVAFHYPELKMVFEHVGGWHYFKEMVGVIINNQNKGNHLYAGIASVLDEVNQRCWYLGIEGLKDVKWQIGADLMIYGMDYPYNKKEQIEKDIELIKSTDFSDEEIDKILGGNLKQLLGLEIGKRG